MKVFYCLFIFIGFFISACAIQIPTNIRLNDTLMLDTESNVKDQVNIEFISNIQDGIFPQCKQNTKEPDGNYQGLMIEEKTAFEKMLNEYLGMKFSNVDNNSNTKITIQLKDFWVNGYSTDSAAKQTLVVLGGGELNYVFIANLEVYVKIIKDNKTIEKTIKATGENLSVTGIGTGTETSYIYKGKRGGNYTNSDAINIANNKAIMMINKFIEANQL